MYTRSIQNRKDVQELLDYEVKMNPKCVPLEYKYVVLKYIPLEKNKGKIILGVNMDLKLNMIPLSLLEVISISFSQDFYENIVRISK